MMKALGLPRRAYPDPSTSSGSLRAASRSERSRRARHEETTPFASIDRPRALIVALSGIGNLLMASPLFRTLKDANPTVEIDILVAPRGTPVVVEANPRIRQVPLGHPKPTPRQWLALALQLRREHYDVGIITHPGQLIMSAALLAFGGVRRRIGHRYTWGVFPDTRLFLTDPIPLVPHADRPLTDRAAHDVVQNLNLLRPLGVTIDPRDAGYDFPLDATDQAAADHWLGAQQLMNSTLVGIHPGAHRDLGIKRWPADGWSELGDRMSATFGANILVFGGPREKPLTTEVCARMRGASVPVHVPLRTAAALIARCAFFVSNDSGLMHVAVSQNVPTFGLFGPTDERRTAPWGPHGQVIRAPGTRPTYAVSRLPETRKLHDADASLRALSPAQVFSEIRARVPQIAPRPASPP